MDIKKQRWVFYTSLRYLFAQQRSKSRSSFILSALGIALGVMALITVLSVMNGFQQNYIENISNVMSYHLRLDNKGIALSPETLDQISQEPWVLSITPFSDIQTIMTGTVSEPGGALIRGLPPQALQDDQSLKEHLQLRSGELDLQEPRSIIIGHELSRSLGLFPGDTLTLMNLKGDGLSRLAVNQEEFLMVGSFRTGYYEYDSTLAFISLDDARRTMGNGQLSYGIKVPNRLRARRYQRRLQQLPGLQGWEITSWRDYNKAFFNALLMEKILMTLMVSLIFIVVAVNIFHSLKRSVAQRIEEIALLKSMGAKPGQVRGLFILQGLIMSATGALTGLVVGILLSLNINQVFSLVETIVNWVTIFFQSIFSGVGTQDFSIYSSRDFYLIKVPVVMMGSDLAVILIAAMGFSVLAAIAATSKVAAIRPAEVFSYE
jgi:lipoprotein-releasing system permease protein